MWQTPWSTQTSLSRPMARSPRSQYPGRAPLTPQRASPISIVIWMTSSQRCRGAQIANTELGWILDIEAGTSTLPERKLEELLTLVGIPATQRRMVRKGLERLVGKLRSMHLAVPGVVAHLFHIQRALNQRGVDRVWLSPAFHCKLANWKELARPPGGVQANVPGRNCQSGTHLSRVLRHVRTKSGRCVARPGQNGS